MTARAKARKTAMLTYLWDDKLGTFVDYDWRAGRKSPHVTAAAAFPLFVGLASREQARGVAQSLRKTLLRPPLPRRPVAFNAVDFAIMGVVNVTPDSFSDGGQFDDAAQAVAHGRRLAQQMLAADFLDRLGDQCQPGNDPKQERQPDHPDEPHMPAAQS
jgi:hypothetical protein